MSKKNNANTGHYKVAGRERPGQDIDQSVQKKEFAEHQPPHQEKESASTPGTAKRGTE